MEKKTKEYIEWGIGSRHENDQWQLERTGKHCAGQCWMKNAGG